MVRPTPSSAEHAARPTASDGSGCVWSRTSSPIAATMAVPGATSRAAMRGCASSTTRERRQAAHAVKTGPAV